MDSHSRRVYPLDAHELSEEQIAVAFAMTSRRPEPFDQIAEQVSQEKAADFHERWVLGYGHASVAEHAVAHLAVENVSRLACDALEDNRLASYTEKSSRYQVMPEDYFHVPQELDKYSSLKDQYTAACSGLFRSYFQLIDGCTAYLRAQLPQRQGERDGTYNLRLRRIVTDDCRAVLPASTLTNVGVTANARTLEHAISKLLSSRLQEENELGAEVREQARNITPTLIKYAERNEYLAGAAARLSEMESDSGGNIEPLFDGGRGRRAPGALGPIGTRRPKTSSSRLFYTPGLTALTRKSGRRWASLAPRSGRASSAALWRAWGPTTHRRGNLRRWTTPLNT